jgi:hypothetical protein
MTSLADEAVMAALSVSKVCPLLMSKTLIPVAPAHCVDFSMRLIRSRTQDDLRPESGARVPPTTQKAGNP